MSNPNRWRLTNYTGGNLWSIREDNAQRLPSVHSRFFYYTCRVPIFTVCSLLSIPLISTLKGSDWLCACDISNLILKRQKEPERQVHFAPLSNGCFGYKPKLSSSELCWQTDVTSNWPLLEWPLLTSTNMFLNSFFFFSKSLSFSFSTMDRSPKTQRGENKFSWFNTKLDAQDMLHFGQICIILLPRIFISRLQPSYYFIYNLSGSIQLFKSSI